MKPLSYTYIQPLSTSHLELLAAARFAHLREHAEDEGQRKELMQSGVSAARIGSLYPFDPSEIDGYVGSLISKDSFAKITGLDVPMLTEAADAVKRLMNIFPVHVRERLETAHSSDRSKVSARTLQPQVAALLPMADAAKRAIAAAMIVGGLWYSTAGMAELEEIAPPSRALSPNRRIVLEAFLRSTDLALPHLRQNELSEATLNQWLESRKIF